MTTVSLARPTLGAGPHPKNRTMDYRAYERIIDAATNGNIIRDDRYEYVNVGSRRRNVTKLVHAAEDRGFLHLTYDGSVTVTAAGVRWRRRPRVHGGKPAEVAAVFSGSGQVA